jgi:hypothetical protein
MRDINANYLRLGPQALADWLANDLERAGALKREGERSRRLSTPKS